MKGVNLRRVAHIFVALPRSEMLLGCNGFAKFTGLAEKALGRNLQIPICCKVSSRSKCVHGQTCGAGFVGLRPCHVKHWRSQELRQRPVRLSAMRIWFGS